MKKESDSEPLSNKKYLKTKIEFYSDEEQIFMMKKYLK